MMRNPLHVVWIAAGLLAGCAPDGGGEPYPPPPARPAYGTVAPAPRPAASRADRAGGVDEAKVPYNDLLRYPDNWPDIVEARDRGGAR